ncbi:hypothetical protein J18TS1_37840 [Oceanobacillus oncorhynchi subsp. incaldanensis]|nr:hypothetical protein J18TS1_37840 [Oceanobacillus oncorhynchi subsp. incaldanensis]
MHKVKNRTNFGYLPNWIDEKNLSGLVTQVLFFIAIYILVKIPRSGEFELRLCEQEKQPEESVSQSFELFR